MIRADVLIIGGGPAGAACAWQLARGGADVLILEKALYPRPKTCAGWITPGVLKVLGPLIEGYPHGITHFTHFEVAIGSLNFGLKTSQYAIRRIEFDDWLARQCGAPIHHHRAQVIERADGGFVVDGQYASRVIVGAGGTNCPVYHRFFRESPNRHAAKQIIAQEEEFAYPHEDPICRLWFFQEGLPGYAWYVPKAGGIVNVGVGAKVSRLKQSGDQLSRHWDLLVERLARMGLVTGHDYQPSGHSYYLRQRGACVQREGAYLIGDAAGLSTLDMGEGISAAIHSGILAARAILTGGEYTVESIGRFSFPALLGIRGRRAG